jgi:predicted enzyme related to lactoylglutathione lyase
MIETKIVRGGKKSMLDLNSMAIGSAKPKKLAKFYRGIFKKAPDWEDGDWSGWQVGSTFLHIGPHEDVKGKAREPQRIMFNFETKQVKREYTRISALGAKVIAAPYQMGGMWVATFADPDGNYFQLISPWE